MRPRHAIHLSGAIHLVGPLALAIALVGTPEAAAAPALRLPTLHVPTVAHGPACVGQVVGDATSIAALQQRSGPPIDNRGRLYVSAAGGFAGISENLGAPCDVTVTIEWRNLGSGRTGRVSGTVAGLLIPVAPLLSLTRMVTTGSGRVELVVTTDRPHLPARGTVVVH
ncbi:hypothetical protein V1Y59_14580 [Gordonia sp. PKS22-38]|uniref:Uncharacterized protein n=1 Tax=Gordonia prachuapensis TaxID=3115651 RepID=A0ABU7MVN8_9ACTN|nr:hypothetical protein [Gordonia sp. PKS22-38]